MDDLTSRRNDDMRVACPLNYWRYNGPLDKTICFNMRIRCEIESMRRPDVLSPFKISQYFMRISPLDFLNRMILHHFIMLICRFHGIGFIIERRRLAFHVIVVDSKVKSQLHLNNWLITQESGVLNGSWNGNTMALAIIFNKLWSLREIHDIVIDIVSEFGRETFSIDSLLNHLENSFYVFAYFAHMFLPYLCLYGWICFIFRVVLIEPDFRLSMQVESNQIFVGYEWPMESLHGMEGAVWRSEE